LKLEVSVDSTKQINLNLRETHVKNVVFETVGMISWLEIDNCKNSARRACRLGALGLQRDTTGNLRAESVLA
jgi:hypothetical protein